jgi:hypothetical protein
VIGDDAELILLDLDSGVSTRLTEALDLRPPLTLSSGSIASGGSRAGHSTAPERR